MPALSGCPLPLDLGTGPSPRAQEKLGQVIDRFVDPEATLDLIAGRTRLLLLKSVPSRIQVAREEIAEYSLVTGTELLLQGKQVGDTTLTLWFTDPQDKAKQIILTYLVRVFPDPQAKERLERAYKALEIEINQFFCDSSIHLAMLGDKVVVSGTVKDVAEGTQILRIVRANVSQGGEAAKVPVGAPAAAAGPDSPQAPATEDFQSAGGTNVINLLHVPGEQQVMLRVTVAEINRTAARSIGLNFSITNNQGITVFSNNTGLLVPFNVLGGAGGSAGGAGGLGGGGLGGGGLGGGGFGFGFGGTIANLSAMLDSGHIPLAILALRNHNYARSLAEPTLTTLNGQTANFQAGGQFPVPVVSGTTFAGLQGVQFIPYGVQVSFTPYITDKTRIRLAVRANVSTRDVSTGTSIGGSGVPGLTTRNFNTTVELREGETMAVAGLIQTNAGNATQRVPFLGEMPFIGQFTGITQATAGEQELVILVTPILAHPMEPGQVPPLPGSDLFEPNDVEFYLVGRLESHCPIDNRSPIRTDLSRSLQYRKVEQMHLSGPIGYSVGP